jgi:hypothetical protein
VLKGVALIRCWGPACTGVKIRGRLFATASVGSASSVNKEMPLPTSRVSRQLRDSLETQGLRPDQNITNMDFDFELTSAECSSELKVSFSSDFDTHPLSTPLKSPLKTVNERLHFSCSSWGKQLSTANWSDRHPSGSTRSSTKVRKELLQNSLRWDLKIIFLLNKCRVTLQFIFGTQ